MKVSATAEELRAIGRDAASVQNPFRALFNPRLAHLEYEDHLELVRGLPYQTKRIPAQWIERIAAGEEAPEFDQDFALDIFKPSLFTPLTESRYWPRIKALVLRKESSLEQLTDVDLGHVESLHFTDFDDKAQKPPALSLPALRELRCNGQMKSLKNLAKAFDLVERLESLTLEGGLKKPATFLFEAGATPHLRELALNVMWKPKNLVPLFEGAELSGLRSLDVGGNTLHPDVAAVLKAKPSYSKLEELRISGQMISAPTVKAFIDHEFGALKTLDVRNSVTYGGLGKAPPGPKILKAVAKASPLPVENLLGDFWPDESSLKAIATTASLPSLKRLYLRAAQMLHPMGPGVYDAADVLRDPAVAGRNEQTAKDLGALRAAEPLMDRGVRVFVIA